jgi:hypothetical protein
MGFLVGGLVSLDLAILALSGLLSCSSASEGEGGSGEGSNQSAPIQPGQGAPAVDIRADAAPAPLGRYQFVDTPDGMTVEVIRADAVSTLSCPVRSCAGLCDECAAAACRSAGELEVACTALVASCSESCNCGSGGLGCGFPVCAYDRQLCYIGGENQGAGPRGPEPDPSPEAGGANPGSGGASDPSPFP